MQRLCITIILLSLVCIGAIAQAIEAPDRVIDASFEQSALDLNAGYWRLEGAGGFTTDAAHAGNAAAQLIGPQRYESAWVQTIAKALVPGQEYIVTAWAKAEVDGAVASIGIRWDEGYPRVFRGLRAQDGWQRIEFRFQVPDPVPPEIALVLSGEHDGLLLWDDIELFEARDLQQQIAAEWEPLLAAGRSLYTGLVINATGLGVERGMSPRIYDTEGHILFAGAGASGEQLITQGVVAYTRSLDDAVIHPRLSVHETYPLRLPLIVDAVEGRDMPRTGIVLSQADARRVREALQTYDFFGRFAVVIIVD